MSVPSISDSLFATRDDMTDDEKLKQAQKIHDALMKGFPGLAKAIADAQIRASKVGYTETILGRRRHHPNMMLPKFEFKPMKGYVNPDIDPLDPKSLENKEQIPKRIVDALTKEFNSYKWYGKIVKRTKELEEEKIKVVNNSYKIEEASRQVFNCVDKETEILTKDGWKKYNEVKVGDEVYSYSIETNEIQIDAIKDIHIYDKCVDVVQFQSTYISAISTLDHRWIVKTSNSIEVKTTRDLVASQQPFSLLAVNPTSNSVFNVPVCPSEISYARTNGVWCVSTTNQTWIARRRRTVYVTGNSIIQGSAAELTKMAMLKLEHDPEWQELGGRFIIPVHDELICEVPLENAEEGAKVLARCMCEAGDFLPFKLTCDVETTFRWYGLPIDVIFEKEKPTSLDWDSLSVSNIEWLQYMLIENEYVLPVFPEEDGSKPSGVRARGVNGIISDELKDAVTHYMNRYQLQAELQFLDHIEKKVILGVM